MVERIDIKPEKLKVGLLLDGYDAAAWSRRLIEDIADSEYAQLSLIVMNGNLKPQPNNTLLAKLFNNRARLMKILIRRFLDGLYRLVVDRNMYLPDAFEIVNLEQLIRDVPTLTVKTRGTKWSDYFGDRDIEKIGAYDLDVIVRLGFRILRGDILNVAKYGIWSFHHGDNRLFRGGPAGYWESMLSTAETGVILQILTEDLDNGKVLFRSFSCTDALSVRDNCNRYYWKSIAFVRRKLRELHRVGGAEFLKKVDHENRHPAFYSEKLYVRPTISELTKLTAKKIWDKVKVQFRNGLYFEQWILMYDMKETFSSSLWRYKRIVPPKDRFWADPHIVFERGVYYVFIEEYLFGEKRAIFQ